MPRVRPLTENGRIKQADERICENCVNQMFKRKVKHKEVAELAGITESALSKQVSNRKLSVEVIMSVIYLTGCDANEVMRI